MEIKRPSRTWLTQSFEADIKQDDIEYENVTDPQRLKEIVDTYDNENPIAVDTETSGLDHRTNFICGFCISFDPYHSYYIPVKHASGENFPIEKIDILLDSLYESDQKILFYNSRFDLKFLREFGADLDQIDWFDTAILMYNMDLNMGKPLSLKFVMGSIFGWNLQEIDIETISEMDPASAYIEEDTIEKFIERHNVLDYLTYEQKQPIFEQDIMPSDDLLKEELDPGMLTDEQKLEFGGNYIYEYGAQDASGTYLIHHYFEEYMDKRNKPITIDDRFDRVLFYMEDVPKRVDLDYCKSQLQKVENKMSLMKSKIETKLGVDELNPNSPKQLREAFKDNDIDTEEETDTGKMSTAEGALESIQDEYDVVDDIMKHRKLEKTYGTYLKPLVNEYQDGIEGVRFSYKNTRVKTGRLAGGGGNNTYFSSINCQGLTKTDEVSAKLVEGGDLFGYEIQDCDEDEEEFETTEKSVRNIRRGLLPQRDCFWVCIDYSGQEVVLAANYSDDPNMIEELKKPDGDLHQKTTDEILRDFGFDKRKYGKKLNFGIFYGQTEYGIKETFGIPEEDAEEIINAFWETYPKYAKWRSRQQEKVKNERKVETFFNRVQHLDNLIPEDIHDNLSTNWWDLSDERQNDRRRYYQSMNFAVNYPIQSAGSDIIKLAVTKCYNDLVKDSDHIELELQVHDEQNFSVKKDPEIFKECIKKLKDMMTLKIKGWELPLEVDVEVGLNYGRLVPIKFKNDGLYLVGEYKI